MSEYLSIITVFQLFTRYFLPGKYLPISGFSGGLLLACASRTTTHRSVAMASKGFNFFDFLIRLIAAIILVFATYNPSQYSWYHWISNATDRFDPVILFTGIVLLIGWVIYLRTTARSLGVLGVILALAFVASLVWVLVDFGVLSITNPTFFQYIVLFVLSLVLATGMSWSHIRRKMTGQIDVDDVEEG